MLTRIIITANKHKKILSFLLRAEKDILSNIKTSNVTKIMINIVCSVTLNDKSDIIISFHVSIYYIKLATNL